MLGVAVLTAGFASADTLTWTGMGGNALWSNANNWSSSGDHAVPQNGDSVFIDIGETATTVENDIANLSLARFAAVGTNDVVLTIDGNPIGLVGIDETGVAEKNLANVGLWTNTCSVLLNAGISLTGGNGSIFLYGYSNIAYGDIKAASGCALKLRGRPKAANATYSTKIDGVSVNVPYADYFLHDDPVFEFYGDVGGDGSDLYINIGKNSYGNTAYFYGNVNCAHLWTSENSESCIVYLMKPGNRVQSIVFAMSSQVYANTVDCFTGDTVINYSKTHSFVETRTTKTYLGGIRFMPGSHQILDRLLGSDPATHNYLRAQYIMAAEKAAPWQASSSGCTLELQGTADAVSYVSLCHNLDVIWNPKGNFTQDFRDREHFTSGSIYVKGGTVRTSGTNTFENLSYVIVESGNTLEIASTNETAFASLVAMGLGAGARLRVADADAVPFTAGKTILAIASGAKVEMVAGSTMNVGRLFYNGTEVEAGSYTQAEWKDGADGTVVVAGSTSLSDYFWGLNDGEWGTASSWFNGAVPGASDAATVFAMANDVTASFDGSSDILPTKTTVKGGGGVATVELSGEVDLNSKNLTVSSGGKVVVPVGATLKNIYSTLTVESDGVVEVTGTMIADNTKYVNNGGGSVVFKDNGELKTPNTGATRVYFGAGDTVFTGDSKFRLDKGDYPVVAPQTPTDPPARMIFKDHAGIVGAKGLDSIRVGSYSGYNGDAVLEFLSDVDHRSMATMYVGHSYGNGKVVLGAGSVSVTGRGLALGCSGGGRYAHNAAKSGGVGTLVVTGGVLTVGYQAVNEGLLTGLRVGDASSVDASIADNYVPWRGYYLQDGGTVTNKGNCCVGGQRTIGYFRQTGGTFVHTCPSYPYYPFFVGIRGGTGEVHFDGGAATIKGDVYAGGIFTNVIAHSATATNKLGELVYRLADYGWDVDVHYGTGLFSVSNGTVALQKNLNLGWDGTGIVERVGSAGSFTVAGNVMMSNTTAIASASILRFVLDANGIAPIQVGGSLTTTPGSRIEVDISAYTGRRGKHALLTASAINGSFADVEIISADGGPKVAGAEVTVESSGLYLTIPSGTVLIFR